METKTKLYAVEARNDGTDENCLIDAFMNSASAMDFAVACLAWLTDKEKPCVSMRGVDSYTRKMDELNHEQKGHIRCVAPYFVQGPYAGCYGMHLITVYEFEFESDFEALVEIAVIRSEADRRNVKFLEQIA